MLALTPILFHAFISYLHPTMQQNVQLRGKSAATRPSELRLESTAAKRCYGNCLKRLGTSGRISEDWTMLDGDKSRWSNMIHGIPWSLIYCTVETGFGSHFARPGTAGNNQRGHCAWASCHGSTDYHLSAKLLQTKDWFYAPKRHVGTNMGRRIDNV